MTSKQTDYPRLTYRLLLGLAMLPLLLVNTLHAQDKGTAVITERVQQAEVIEEVPLTGTVISSRQARLSTEISGLIDNIDVDIGDRVSEGDVILTLKSDLEQLSLQAKRAEAEQVRRELADARRRLADAERLGRTNTVSANEINSLKAEVSIDAAEVTRLQAEEQQQQLRLRQHTLRAPFAGVISARNAERGEWVAPGHAVVELVSMTVPEIEFQVPQRVYERLGAISRIEVSFGTLPGETFSANIISVVPVTDRGSRTFPVRARHEDNEVSLIPGISASATLHISNSNEGVVVDRNALIRYPDGRITVWVVEQNDGQTTVIEKQVETGLSFNGRINITSGLATGELIVVRGNESLREGQKVNVRQTND